MFVASPNGPFVVPVGDINDIPTVNNSKVKVVDMPTSTNMVDTHDIPRTNNFKLV